MKVIFLDIDGVLNSHQYLSQVALGEADIYDELDPEKFKLLQMIVEQIGASIVLSSSWRESFEAMKPLESVARNLLTALKEHGLTIYDMTPILTGQRDEEIRQWLSCHVEVDGFVILDDEHFDWKELEAHWVKTSYYMGLTEENAQEALRILQQL